MMIMMMIIIIMLVIITALFPPGTYVIDRTQPEDTVAEHSAVNRVLVLRRSGRYNLCLSSWKELHVRLTLLM
jgi:hypothetical protein